MKMKKKLILYPSGCYGTFIEWICNFLTTPDFFIPFQENGSSHNYKGNSINSMETFSDALKSEKDLFRCHPFLIEPF
jgi:hypothetical protein